MWMSKDQVISNVFGDVDEQPQCVDSLGIPSLSDSGLSFPQYKWSANQDYSCRLSSQACQLNCNLSGGLYRDETGECYELHALRKICVKVSFKYVDDLPPAEAEVVSNVALTTGCYEDGNAGYYELVSLSPDS